METNNDWYTAIHEAGHAVAFIMYSELVPEGFKYVTIEPSDDAIGRVISNELQREFDPGLFAFDTDDETNREMAGLSQPELEARLCVFLAGEAATYIKTGDRDNLGSGRNSWEGDFAACMEFLTRVFPCGNDPDAYPNLAAHHYLEALYWRTVYLLSLPSWAKRVSGIAQALIEKRTLSAEECRQAGLAAIKNPSQ